MVEFILSFEGMFVQKKVSIYKYMHIMTVITCISLLCDKWTRFVSNLNIFKQYINKLGHSVPPAGAIYHNMYEIMNNKNYVEKER